MSRKLHRLGAWITAIPLLVIVLTGIFLQIKTWVPWIQPRAVQGSGINAQLEMKAFLNAAISYSPAQVQNWKEIRSIDIRPESGVARVRTRSNYEISIDLASGKLISAAARRTNLLIELHEGSLFGNPVRYGIYLPASVLFLGVLGSGIFLLFRPLIRRNLGERSENNECSSK